MGQLVQVEECTEHDGRLVVSKRYFVDEQNRKQGVYEELNTNGAVVKKGLYIDDQLDGLLEVRQDSRNYQIISYSKGKREGIFVEYQDSLLVRRGAYHDDKLVKEERFQYRRTACRYEHGQCQSIVHSGHLGVAQAQVNAQSGRQRED